MLRFSIPPTARMHLGVILDGMHYPATKNHLDHRKQVVKNGRARSNYGLVHYLS